MEEIEYWEAVRSRNRAYDGVFVYAVRSTGIYCRPSCPSRRPRREHVQFFGSPDRGRAGRLSRVPALPAGQADAR